MQNRPKQRVTRDYFSRREQRRLLILMMGLGLVVLLIFQALKPKNWAWLTGDQNVAPQTQVKGTGPVPDTRLKKPGKQLPLDVFEIRAQEPAEDETETTGQKSAQAVASASDEQESAPGYFEGVQPELLQPVKDNTHLLKDAKAWYHLMTILEKTGNDQLVRESIGRVGYLQLYNQPEVYRGKLVTIAGSIRRAYYFVDKNKDSGIEGHYQIFLRPNSNHPKPIVIYSLNLPEGFPTGDNLDQQIELTGFFFKRWPYNAKDTTRLAPLVLAKTFSWKKDPEQSSFNFSVWNFVILIGGTLVFSVLVAVMVFKRSQLITLPGQDGVRPTASPGDLSALKNEEILPDIKEHLEQIANKDRTPQ